MLRVLSLPPHSRVYYIAPTFPVIRDVSKTTLRKITDNLYRASGVDLIESERVADNEITLINKTVICFRSAENYEKLRGISTQYLFIDEGAIIDSAAWDILAATLREGKTRLFITTTPFRSNKS
jgi:hypothetical protein